MKVSNLIAVVLALMVCIYEISGWAWEPDVSYSRGDVITIASSLKGVSYKKLIARCPKRVRTKADWRRLKKLFPAIEKRRNWLETQEKEYDEHTDPFTKKERRYYRKIFREQIKIERLYQKAYRILNVCTAENTKYKIKIINDSSTDLALTLIGASVGGEYKGLINRETEIVLEYSVKELADSNKRNALLFRPTFNGQPIEDPGVIDEVERAFKTQLPWRKPCVVRKRYRFTNRTFAPGSGVIVPPPEPTPTPPEPLSTENWAGTWKCEGPDNPELTISGKGLTSSIDGYYSSTRWGAATETYKILEATGQSASGTYTYYDDNPAVGSSGQAGVWPGHFSMTLSGETIALRRSDDSSSWVGNYTCRKQ